MAAQRGRVAEHAGCAEKKTNTTRKRWAMGGFYSPRPERVTEVTYSTFRAQPPGEYSHRPAGTQTPLDWHPRSFSWHPNRYEAGTQSLFESDQPNERTRNALMLFRVALYDCLWRRSNSEREEGDHRAAHQVGRATSRACGAFCLQILLTFSSKTSFTARTRSDF